MTEPNTDPTPIRRWTPFSALRLVIFSITCVCLITVFVNDRSAKGLLDRQVAAQRDETKLVSSKREQLRDKERELDKAINDAKQQGDQLKTVFQYASDVDDFWQNDAALGVFTLEQKGNMNDLVRLLLPSGVHKLQIEIERSVKDSDAPKQTTQLTYDLHGTHAYEIALVHERADGADYRDPRELKLRVTSSYPEFQSIERSLFPERLPPPTTSSTSMIEGRIPVFFPNQMPNDHEDETDGVLINRMSWSFKPPDAEAFTLTFTMRLESDGPRIVPAENQSLFRYGVNKKEMKYIGKGRYEVLQ
ncbi:hypothetical protein [Rhodopirellula sp. MGV]|uniref:hypothetical protein n=1 Tax=Rhodopirellula sp. MGV TaxID=2023130 RepID=UPI000B9677E2|nr:hypothetical protein [Rhodopirellula sp. MGV]OYP34124.1 hypothetical protein CGZ80_15805 [Rhodopirellula sp. MGV]PNY33562.1 hypothetical protein C2E31_27535 [Rhodopirellula baltica]